MLDETYCPHGPIFGRIHYIFTYNAIIDLIALIPSLVEWFNGSGVGGGKGGIGTGIRLWRIVRIMKLEHYSRAFATLQGGFKQQGKLWKLVMIYPCVALVIFATLLSFTETLENGANIDTAVHFSSIPRGKD